MSDAETKSAAENASAAASTKMIGAGGDKNGSTHARTTKHWQLLSQRRLSWLIAVWLLFSTAAVFLNSIYNGVIVRLRTARLELPVDGFPDPIIGPPSPDRFDEVDLLAPSILAVTVFLLHFSYLYIVAWEQIYKRHASKREIPNIVLILLLGSAYIIPTILYLFGGHWGVQQSAVKVVSVSSFAVLYLSWCLIDWYELHRDDPRWFHHQWRRVRIRVALLIRRLQFRFLDAYKNEQDRYDDTDDAASNTISTHSHGELTTAEQVQKSVWMYIDLVLGIVLLFAIFGYLLSKWDYLNERVRDLSLLLNFNWAEAFTIKEVAVAVTIVAWFVIQIVIKNSSKGSEVLSHKLWQDTIEHHDKDSNPIDLPATLQNRISENRPLNVLVANCGTGKRTKQLLKLLHYNKKPLYDASKKRHSRSTEGPSAPSDYRQDGVHKAVRLYGYNHDKSVEGYGEHVDHDHFTSDHRLACRWASKADLIIVLHSTYDASETNRIERVLEGAKEHKDGCLVLVRGFADHSYLATICYHLIDRGFAETPRYHVWNSEHLDLLSRRMRFAQVHLTDASQPRREFAFRNYNVTSILQPPATETLIQACMIIHQHFKITPFTNACIEDYLSRQFDPVRAELVAHQLELILRTTRLDPTLNAGLNADDFVYAFWAGAAPTGMPLPGLRSGMHKDEPDRDSGGDGEQRGYA